jgi:hypothetical protein
LTLESADSVYSSSAPAASADRAALELALDSDELFAPAPIEASVSLNAFDDDAPGDACCTQPVTVMGCPAPVDRLCVSGDDCACTPRNPTPITASVVAIAVFMVFSSSLAPVALDDGRIPHPFIAGVAFIQ